MQAEALGAATLVQAGGDIVSIDLRGPRQRLHSSARAQVSIGQGVICYHAATGPNRTELNWSDKSMTKKAKRQLITSGAVVSVCARTVS